MIPLRSASPPSLTLALVVLTFAACRAGEPESHEPAKQADAASKPASPPSDAAAAGPRLETPSAPDPERAAKLDDLDALCQAVDHDYKDGTLGDYYRGLKMTTAWGQAQLDTGNESIQPGRLLEKAVAGLSPGAADPALEHCRTLLDYLDDVE